MAELIEKQTVLDWVQKQIEAVTKKQVSGSDGIFTREVLTTMQRDLSAFEKAINAMPNTTEAEIRNKAIDEFAEKLKNNISPMSHGLGVHDIDRITEEMKNSCIRKTFREVDTDYIAEQLKEK